MKILDPPLNRRFILKQTALKAATSGAIRWVILLATASVALALVAALVAFNVKRSRPVIPKPPDDAVQVVVQGLADNQPQVLWDALPASYQADIRQIIAAFCANMDPEIYDRTFRILGKAVKVLNEMKDYFARSPVALSVPLLESSIGRNWSHDVGLLDTVVQSDLATLATLKQMDPGIFLASTGHKVMAGLDDLRARTQRSPGPNLWEKMNQSLKDARIQFVKTTEDRGYLKFISPTNSVGKDVHLTRVEGRWVPADFAASWTSKAGQAKERMGKLSGPEFAKAKPLLAMVLGALENNLDSLLKAGSQKEFDEKLKGFAAIGGMLQSMKDLQNRGAQ